ncbi:MAG: DsrE family protein [Sphingomicrobium sp.]
MNRLVPIILSIVLSASPALANPANFSRGPIITEAGGVAKVAADVPLPAGKDWKMDFDVPTATPGKLNPRIDAAARFINMLAASGVPMANIHAAIVVRANGLLDLLDAQNYGRETDGQVNPNTALLLQLIAKGVPVYVCGQSAELLDIKKSEMIPGVKMALSAMTVHADLQGRGYVIDP